MYQLVNNPLSGAVAMIVRLADRSFIPLDADNTDYKNYLAWVAAGNTPLPAA